MLLCDNILLDLKISHLQIKNMTIFDNHCTCSYMNNKQIKFTIDTLVPTLKFTGAFSFQWKQLFILNFPVYIRIKLYKSSLKYVQILLPIHIRFRFLKLWFK